jgi:hypothetical protein
MRYSRQYACACASPMTDFAAPVSKTAPSKELLGARGIESARTVGIDEGHFPGSGAKKGLGKPEEYLNFRPAG